MKKKLKQPLFLKGYETNPQGKRTPIFSTIEPAVPFGQIISESSSLPGARKKKEVRKH